MQDTHIKISPSNMMFALDNLSPEAFKVYMYIVARAKNDYDAKFGLKYLLIQQATQLSYTNIEKSLQECTEKGLIMVLPNTVAQGVDVVVQFLRKVVDSL